MTVSLWETSVHLPPEPCALADENFAEILRPLAKAASPRKPVKVDVPAAGIPPAASVNVEASIVPPAVAGPSQPLGPSSTATAARRNTAPPSPLTSIDGDESDSDSGTEKIPRPARASQIPFDSLFGWQNGTLEKVQAHIKKIAPEHLNVHKNFMGQDEDKLIAFYRAMRVKFPMLEKYSKNWATIRLLQAHLKARGSSHRHAAQKEHVKVAKIALEEVAGPTTRANLKTVGKRKSDEVGPSADHTSALNIPQSTLAPQLFVFASSCGMCYIQHLANVSDASMPLNALLDLKNSVVNDQVVISAPQAFSASH
ncbi:hypothetical protein B0H16DRAFT_1452365 [Mycena metata]|uniref:Uncharacterized protein n=1 Tax=Mycena metata TaxID=1033252 RepID=A0AAD7JQX6_9AGAR|nr:hypothetical protein B0H16DRAFT_1452365 [Mycena metata]